MPITKKLKLAVIIPSYKVKKTIIDVVNTVGKNVSKIYVVDDFCPEGSGKFVLSQIKDRRVKVIFNKKNLGVGGAVIEGYKQAIKDNIDIAIKIDGDNQMDPRLLDIFVTPISEGHADYTKGNRFYNLSGLKLMPKGRLLGNAALSFATKISSGYWNIFDPTNGYTAIHTKLLSILELDKVSKRFFFETDMLFRLNIIKAVVVDIPMNSKYSDEISNIKIHKIFFEFTLKHFRNFVKRIFYNYYLRDMSLASIELIFGIFLVIFSVCYGFGRFFQNNNIGQETPTGEIMITFTSIILGIQLILAFLSYDINSMPKNPIHKSIFK